MLELSKRQNLIYEIIRSSQKSSVSEIISTIKNKQIEISRWTVLRDIDKLLNEDLIIKIGKGRTAGYSIPQKNLNLLYIDPVTYFQSNYLERVLINEKFNFDIFLYLIKKDY